jgi:hypothetical protein
MMPMGAALLVAWEVYVVLTRFQMRGPQAAPQAFAKTTSIIDGLASRISDKRLTATFMNSPAVYDSPATIVTSATHNDI